MNGSNGNGCSGHGDRHPFRAFPLHRLTEFFDEKDTELLLGESIAPSCFNDANLGMAVDKIYEKGTQSIISKISQTAFAEFGVDARRLNFDTTSVPVYGDYTREEDDEPPFKITYGYSKDKRPDLKQFLISMLCVDRNISIFGATKDGNSDKTLNNEILSQVSKHMASHGLSEGAYVYVADSALVSEANLWKWIKTALWLYRGFPQRITNASAP